MKCSSLIKTHAFPVGLLLWTLLQYFGSRSQAGVLDSGFRDCRRTPSFVQKTHVIWVPLFRMPGNLVKSEDAENTKGLHVGFARRAAGFWFGGGFWNHQ